MLRPEYLALSIDQISFQPGGPPVTPTPWGGAGGRRWGTAGPEGWNPAANIGPTSAAIDRPGAAQLFTESGAKQPFQNQGRQPLPGPRPVQAGGFGPKAGDKPHTQIGQQGKGTGAPKGGGKTLQAGGSPGVGGMPEMPPTAPNFLPMTPGYEAVQRGANDQLMGAEGQYATGQTMVPAQVGLQKQRIQTDMDVATQRMREELAGRGVFTPYGANGQRTSAPVGGGIGQTLHQQRIATPYGRQFQDLAAGAAGQYGDMASAMGGAYTGYNEALLQGLLGRASDAFSAMPTSLPLGGYDLPDMVNPSFTAPPKPRSRRSSAKKNAPKKGSTKRRGRK